MTATRSQATKRLIKKLGALRATLPNEERKLLDSIMGVEEVSANRMKPQAKPAAKSSAKEVAANRMKPQAKPAAKSSAKEVAANRMKPQAKFRIVFDPNSEEYQIQE